MSEENALSGNKNPETELETMKRKLAEMEEEALKLRKLQEESEKADEAASKEAADARSVYIGNVDYGASPDELQKHFESCGSIQRVTILCDKPSQRVGLILLIFWYAYIEFANEDSIPAAVALNESVLRGRLIKVLPKRTNVPYFAYPQQRTPSGYRGHRGGYQHPPPHYYSHPPMYYYPPRGGRGGYMPNRGAERYHRGSGSYRGGSGRRGPFHSSPSIPSTSDDYTTQGGHSSPSSSTSN